MKTARATPHFQPPPFLWKKEKRKSCILYPLSALISSSRCREAIPSEQGIASLIVPSSSKPRLSESIANSPPSTHTDTLRKLYWVLPLHIFPPPSPLVRAPSPSRRPLLFPISHFPSYFIQCPFPISRRLYANPLSFSPPNQVSPRPPTRPPLSSPFLAVLSFPSAPHPGTCSTSPPPLPTPPFRYSFLLPSDRQSSPHLFADSSFFPPPGAASRAPPLPCGPEYSTKHTSAHRSK